MKRCPTCSGLYPVQHLFCPVDGAELVLADEDETAPLDDPIASVFAGNYRILEQLGSGGMGAVYKAEHCYLDRTVAIKVLHPTTLQDEPSLARFRREAEVAIRIDHPHAISVFDFGVENGRPYIVMEYVEGRTLKQLLAEEGAVPIERSLKLAEQIAAALSAAHAQGILHRDLKPENIMLCRSTDGGETVKVLDFGISKILNPEDPSNDKTLTKTGILIGTPKYMSPEQAAAKPLDQRSDLYSFAVVIYEMINGEPPFFADSPLEMVMQHLQAEPKSCNPSLRLPVSFEQSLMRGLQKDPQDRPSDVATFMKSLWEGYAGKAKEQSQRVTAPRADSGQSNNNTKALFVAVGLLLIFVAAFFVWRYGLLFDVETPFSERKPRPLPSAEASALPTSAPSPLPSIEASAVPTSAPSPLPSAEASALPTAAPSPLPSIEASALPTSAPSPLATAVAKPKATANPDWPAILAKPPAGIYIEVLTAVTLQNARNAAEALRSAGYQAYVTSRESSSYDVIQGPYKNLWKATQQTRDVKRLLGIESGVTVTRQLF